MNKKPSKPSGAAAKKTADKISLAKLAPEIARKNMKALLLANPNYFGSQEFVRFYLSYDNGATWQDQGLTNFTVYDVAGRRA